MYEAGSLAVNLADNFAVDDRLVSGLDGGGVGEDGNISIELPGGFRLGGFPHQHHPLSHKVPLDLLQGERCCLPCHDLRQAAVRQSFRQYACY